MAGKRWQVTVHPLAEDEVRRLKEEEPLVYDAVKETMRELESMQDPRQYPYAKALGKFNHELKGWYRVTIRKFNYRVLFQILQVRGKSIIQVFPCDDIDPRSAGVIQITRVAHRGEAGDVYNSPKTKQRAWNIRFRGFE